MREEGEKLAGMPPIPAHLRSVAEGARATQQLLQKSNLNDIAEMTLQAAKAKDQGASSGKVCCSHTSIALTNVML